MQVVFKDTRVVTFLDSIGRNSKNSMTTYKTGLKHFADFLKTVSPKKDSRLTPNSIISLLQNQRINTYELLDQFVSYLSKKNIAVRSVTLYIAAVRSYLEFSDIDIVPNRFRRRVKMPKFYPDPEEPLSLSDIRDLLEYCKIDRLRTYIILLTSSGLRAIEAASLRLMDVDFTTSPTKITVRREFSKTKRSRTIYCSDEATTHLQKLIEFRKNKLGPDSLIFSIRINSKEPSTIYNKLLHQFEYLLTKVGKDQRKENSRRRKITLHSFRRTCFSIINDQVGSEYANWFLGHNHSVYWSHIELERREIYR
ncbi:MAG: tyrosine-type recombinase/integrase, partial [Nitrososphaeraceae archaeon]